MDSKAQKKSGSSGTNTQRFIRYNSKHPTYSLRVDLEQQKRIEQVRQKLGYSKQEFLEAMYELAIGVLEGRA
jgi:hypothetical protein